MMTSMFGGDKSDHPAYVLVGKVGALTLHTSSPWETVKMSGGCRGSQGNNHDFLPLDVQYASRRA